MEVGSLDIIQGCKKGHRHSQKAMYRLFYNYAMKICARYAQDEEEAQEMLNDAFLKVFLKINQNYNPDLSFKAWLNKIIVNTAIDYFRKQRRQIEQPPMEVLHLSHETDALDQLAADEILAIVQTLPPAYRLVFNLYAIEGYKHHEIAQMLQITVGTSKSNLAKARMHLKAKMHQLNKEKKSNYG